MSDILRDSPVGNLWHRVAISWLISFLLIAVLLIPTISVLHFNAVYLAYIAAFALSGALVLWVIGNLAKVNPRRVLVFVLILAFFGLFPLVLFLSIAGFGFFVFFQGTPNLQFVIRSLLVAVIVIWCLYQFVMYRRRIIERRFMELEFLIKDAEITLHRPPKISLDAPKITNKTILGYFYLNVLPYLVLAIPFAYPLQKIIYGTGGVTAIFLVYAVLLGPFAIHSFGRLTCGAYLYVYKVWQLERKYGKPVMFNSN
jgi:hypothetical protein